MAIRYLRIVVLLLCIEIAIQTGIGIGKAEAQTNATSPLLPSLPPSPEEDMKKFREYDHARRKLDIATRPIPEPFIRLKPLYEAQLEEAIIAFRKFVQKYPNDNFYTPMAMHDIAIALIEQGKIQDAMTQLDEIVQKFPNGQAALNAKVQKGRMYLKQRNYPQAIAAFELALEKSANGDEGRKALEEKARPAILYMLVHTHIKMGNHDKAWEIFLKLNSEYPGESYTERAKREVMGKR